MSAENGKAIWQDMKPIPAGEIAKALGVKIDEISHQEWIPIDNNNP